MQGKMRPSAWARLSVKCHDMEQTLSKRDSSLRRPTLSQEVKGEEKVGLLRSE